MWIGERMTQDSCVSLYVCVCVYLYMYVCILMYLCICAFTYFSASDDAGVSRRLELVCAYFDEAFTSATKVSSPVAPANATTSSVTLGVPAVTPDAALMALPLPTTVPVAEVRSWLASVKVYICVFVECANSISWRHCCIS
jgi:hypothetical protein